MALQTLRIDDDDLSDILLDIERGFEISFPRDLCHVHTVGDLQRIVLAEAGEAGGTHCGSSHIFYALRRAFGVEGATPKSSLPGLYDGSPAAARRLLAAQTGWRIPSPPMGWFGCVALIVGVAAALAAGLLLNGLLVLPVLLASWGLVRLDRGAWAGEWRTLGSLARAIAAANHKRLVDGGARHSPVTVWHALLSYLEPYASDRRDIVPETRLLA